MRRVAIIFPEASFDTHSTLRNAALLLARAGYSVDVFIRGDESFMPPRFEEPAIRVYITRTIPPGETPLWGRLARRLTLAPAVARETLLLVRMLVRRNRRARYSLLIGVDPLGIVFASQAARLLRVPAAYFSLELLLAREATRRIDKLLKTFERSASRKAAFVLIQDEGRAALLREDNGIPPERFVLVPNAPLDDGDQRRSRRWHHLFGLPPTERVVLHAGGFAAWTGLADIIASTHSWPAGWSCVVHMRRRPTAKELDRLRPGEAALDRVFFSDAPVSQPEIDELFAAADVGIAFYLMQPGSFYTQENLRSVGLSSGKIAYYLRAGLPVIVNDGTSLSDFVRDEECGVVVSDATEIGAALERIGRDYEGYSGAARRAFEERLDFDKAFAEVIRRIDSLEETPEQAPESTRV